MIQITNEDNVDLMARYKDNHFDLAIVDPPYGIDINMNMGRKKGKKGKHTKKNWDKGIPNKEYFNELMRVSKNQIIWGGNYFPLPLTGSWIFWNKNVPDGVSFADGELAWTSFDMVLKKIDNTYNGFQGMDDGDKIHPTQKPVLLYRKLLQLYGTEGMKILDTHLGSGSIAVACHEEKYDLIACEIGTEYYNKAIKRLKTAQSQTKLF